MDYHILIRRNLIDLCMEESTCHEIVICLLQRFSSMLCFFGVWGFFFLLFFISFKYDFPVDTERMIVTTQREICEEISALMV